MLSKSENEYLCRIGPGTAMGNLMRQYWLPAIRSDELPEPDGAPLRVRLLAAAFGAMGVEQEEGALVVKLPLATNARAKMQGFRDGFVKLFARRNSGMVLGGVVVAPRASELILGVSLAVEQHLTVDQMAHTFAVYPSLSGSITEAARSLMRPADDD